VSHPSTTRQVRKTAEKAALDALAGDMVAVIGDLAVATSNISSATTSSTPPSGRPCPAEVPCGGYPYLGQGWSPDRPACPPASRIRT